jgi:hypothetical protein
MCTPLRATYLQRGRQLLRRLGEHVSERLLRVRRICEFLRRGGGAIVDIPCPRCKLYLSGDGGGGFRAEEERYLSGDGEGGFRAEEELYLSGDGEGGFRAEEEHPVVVHRRQFAS